jgi:hypothetical protein
MAAFWAKYATRPVEVDDAEVDTSSVDAAGEEEAVADVDPDEIGDDAVDEDFDGSGLEAAAAGDPPIVAGEPPVAPPVVPIKKATAPTTVGCLAGLRSRCSRSVGSAAATWTP